MIKKNSLAYFILLALEKSIEAEVRLIDFAYNHHELLYGYPREITYGAIHQAVRDLRLKGFIETEKDGKKVMVRLTEAGRDQSIVNKLLSDENWDNKWRIVIFDIPEKHRRLRNILRGKLREWEFKPWQKSVWIGKKQIEIQLRRFIKEVGLSQWVKVITSVDIDYT